MIWNGQRAIRISETAQYDSHPVLLQASWARNADSDNSYIWNLGASCAFGPALVSLAYEKTDNKGWLLGNSLQSKGKQDTVFLALKWKLGPGTLHGLIDYSKLKDNEYVGNDDNTVMKYALGYTYNLSRTVGIYGNIAYTDYDSDKLSETLRGAYKDYAKSSMGLPDRHDLPFLSRIRRFGKTEMVRNAWSFSPFWTISVA